MRGFFVLPFPHLKITIVLKNHCNQVFRTLI